MPELLSREHAALRMLFTEELYVINDHVSKVPVSSNIQEIEKATDPILDDDSKKVVATDFEYLGDNNKYFLILISDPIHTRINSVHQEMLVKIMSAKKLELRDLAIVNISRYHKANFTSLKAFFTCNRLVLFGVDPILIGLPAIALNKPEQKNSVHIMATYGLEEMRNSPDKKREFWNMMKNF